MIFCYYYNNNQDCPFGKNCIFSHDDSDDCKFGKACERLMCMYKHPENEITDDNDESENENENEYIDETVEDDVSDNDDNLNSSELQPVYD